MKHSCALGKTAVVQPVNIMPKRILWQGMGRRGNCNDIYAQIVFQKLFCALRALGSVLSFIAPMTQFPF